MSDEVDVRIEGGAGRLSLNRPGALHALTLGMCHTMSAALTAWASDAAVEVILIDHATGRGFCAGGDIRFLADSVAKDAVDARRFFHDEYQLDQQLFAYAKPVDRRSWTA